jgi:predicted Zn-dependent protease
MDPGFRVTKAMLMYAYAERGMFREAIADGEKTLRDLRERHAPEDVWIKAVLAHVYALAGDRGQALRLLENLLPSYRQGHLLPETIAIVYVGLGERDEAFAWLDKAVEDRTPFALFLKPSPYYDSLRSDPRFAELLRRVGLPV